MAKIINGITYNGKSLNIVSNYAVDLESELLANRYIGSSSSILTLSGIRYMNAPVYTYFSSTVKELHLPDLEVFSTIVANHGYIEKVFLPKATICEHLYFGQCSKLNEISAPKLEIIETVGQYGFALCSSLSTLNFPNLRILSGGGSFFSNKMSALESVSLPNLEYCNCNLFVPSSSPLSNLVLPKLSILDTNATYIGGNGIYNLDLPELRTVVGSDSKFFYCASGANVNLPKLENTRPQMFVNLKTEILQLPRVRSFTYSVFAGNTTIKSIYAPLCFIVWSSCFRDCTNLETIEIPLVSSFMGGSTFYNCYNLKNITFGPISTLGSTYLNQMFVNCSALSMLSLPSTLTVLSGSYNFSGCINLSQIIINTKIGLVSLGPSNMFTNTPILNSELLGYYGSIYVPSDRVEAYKAASNWSLISDRITSIENLPIL